MEVRHRGSNKLRDDELPPNYGTMEENSQDTYEVKEATIPTSTTTVANPSYNFYNLIYEMLNQVFNYIYETFSAYLPYYEPQLDSTIRQRIENFKLEVAVPYRSDNEQHEERLLNLWKLAFPDEKLLDRKSQQWSKLGFQGKDPATDFRGGGIFALENLLYLANTYPSLFQELIRGSAHIERFPMAVTGINLTMLIFEILGWGMRAAQPATTTAKKAKSRLINLLFGDDVDDTRVLFCELYCVVFDLFDKEWLAMNANTLDFQEVKTRTKTRFESLIAVSTSLQEIKQGSRLQLI